MMVMRVQARGQVTVPQEIRDMCGIVPGSDLVFEPCGAGQFLCRVLPRPRPIDEVLERYAADGTAPDMDEMRGAMAAEATLRLRSPQ